MVCIYRPYLFKGPSLPSYSFPSNFASDYCHGHDLKIAPGATDFASHLLSWTWISILEELSLVVHHTTMEMPSSVLPLIPIGQPPRAG